MIIDNGLIKKRKLRKIMNNNNNRWIKQPCYDCRDVFLLIRGLLEGQ